MARALDGSGHSIEVFSLCDNIITVHSLIEGGHALHKRSLMKDQL